MLCFISKGSRGIITPLKYYVITKSARVLSADRSSGLRQVDTRTRPDRTSPGVQVCCQTSPRQRRREFTSERRREEGVKVGVRGGAR